MVYDWYIHHLNPCADEWFVFIFHSFKAGIANAISSFKLRKNIYIYEKMDISNIELLLN